MSIVSEETIQAMVDRIVEKFKPQKVILFGSYARGNPGKDSDVDLLVIMDYKGRRIDLLRNIRKSLHDIRASKDIVIRSPEEVDKYSEFIGTILYPAMKQGRMMYAAD